MVKINYMNGLVKLLRSIEFVIAQFLKLNNSLYFKKIKDKFFEKGMRMWHNRSFAKLNTIFFIIITHFFFEQIIVERENSRPITS